MEYRNIADIKANPKNPRTIKDDRFKKLCQSLTDFPEMLEKRPLVCFTDTDKKAVVLGGNMRLKAAIEIGLKKLPVVMADDWTEEQKARFLISDNVGFGDWNYDELQADWDVQQLEDWGLEVPFFGHEVNGMTDDNLYMTEDFDPIGISKGLAKIIFIFDSTLEAEVYIKENINNHEVKKLGNNDNVIFQVNLSTTYGIKK